MMQVFCVLLMGEPFLLNEKEFGFYRNEYVLARSKERAVDAAKAQAMKRFERQGLAFIEGKPFMLSVDSVKTGMPLWRLLRNEGFLFFSVDESKSQ